MSGVKTWRHELALRRGRRLTVDVTEAADAIYLQISGDQATGRDGPRLAKFLWPIVSRYEHDHRPIEIDGPRAPGGAHRLHTLAAGIYAVETRPRGRAT